MESTGIFTSKGELHLKTDFRLKCQRCHWEEGQLKQHNYMKPDTVRRSSSEGSCQNFMTLLHLLWTYQIWLLWPVGSLFNINSIYCCTLGHQLWPQNVISVLWNALVPTAMPHTMGWGRVDTGATSKRVLREPLNGHLFKLQGCFVQLDWRFSPKYFSPIFTSWTILPLNFSMSVYRAIAEAGLLCFSLGHFFESKEYSIVLLRNRSFLYMSWMEKS